VWSSDHGIGWYRSLNGAAVKQRLLNSWVGIEKPPNKNSSMLPIAAPAASIPAAFISRTFRGRNVTCLILQ